MIKQIVKHIRRFVTGPPSQLTVQNYVNQFEKKRDRLVAVVTHLELMKRHQQRDPDNDLRAFVIKHLETRRDELTEETKRLANLAKAEAADVLFAYALSL
jgi:hypothetical protein